jgi:hypothetical protein
MNNCTGNSAEYFTAECCNSSSDIINFFNCDNFTPNAINEVPARPYSVGTQLQQTAV